MDPRLAGDYFVPYQLIIWLFIIVTIATILKVEINFNNSVIILVFFGWFIGPLIGFKLVDLLFSYPKILIAIMVCLFYYFLSTKKDNKEIKESMDFNMPKNHNEEKSNSPNTKDSLWWLPDGKGNKREE